MPASAKYIADPFIKEGIRQEQIDALNDWQNSQVFDAAGRAVLAYTDSMTLDKVDILLAPESIEFRIKFKGEL